MRIRTASDQFIIKHNKGYRRFLEMEVARRWHGAAINWRTRGNIHAQVVRSDWIVECPDCGEGLVAEPGEPFYCPQCLMAGNEGFAKDVIFPRERREIEAVLVKRIDPKTRNWLPGETLDMLLAENMEHGEPV